MPRRSGCLGWPASSALRKKASDTGAAHCSRVRMPRTRLIVARPRAAGLVPHICERTLLECILEARTVRSRQHAGDQARGRGGVEQRLPVVQSSSSSRAGCSRAMAPVTKEGEVALEGLPRGFPRLQWESGSSLESRQDEACPHQACCRSD
jgi:hypothetical protein